MKAKISLSSELIEQADSVKKRRKPPTAVGGGRHLKEKMMGMLKEKLYE